jgi:hypothetical protein
MELASALARLVLPTPGTSSMRRWPSDSRHIIARATTSDLPWITCSTLRAIESNSSAKLGASLVVVCVAVMRSLR